MGTPSATYEYRDRNYALAEPVDGETVTWMKAQAAQHGIHLAGSLLLLDEVDIYNTAPLVAPDGHIWRCVKFSELTGAAAHADKDSDTSRAGELDKHAEHAAWMRVPVVHASATGVIRTKLPLSYITLPG